MQEAEIARAAWMPLSEYMSKPLWPEYSGICFRFFQFFIFLLFQFFYGQASLAREVRFLFFIVSIFLFFCTRALERVQIIHTFFPSIFFSVFFGTHAPVLCPYVIILVDEWAGG